MSSIEFNDVLKKYSINTITKIKDFLISEIASDNFEETINFVKCSDEKKQKDFADELYQGNKYKGIFLEGNQYLLGCFEDKVTIIDFIGEEYGMQEIYSKMILPIDDFIYIISHKNEMLQQIDTINKKDS
ncbi:hypothetical protein [Anaerosacchariphilus polymeriproducens]|uniref:Uncharacterized protein n=1 Tax=Anaerosacchariphilus polymeriproducens TaxID=1812858 RepID=A0A371ARN9_9FIRM|nr:hypothetical protein [Anaerosacchariphilus polymeriproducens]RDU22226.1 hypothetical protein DWV06_17030 [Anaerosacchariphilus polymeriproducens]